MRRLQSILVIIAFVAAPLALLARGVFCDPAECTCATVCAHEVSQGKPMCGMARHAAAPMCGTHQGHHALDYGFVAPFAPAVPLPHAALAVPVASREFATQFSQVSVDGTYSVPFEPPRS